MTKYYEAKYGSVCLRTLCYSYPHLASKEIRKLEKENLQLRRAVEGLKLALAISSPKQPEKEE